MAGVNYDGTVSNCCNTGSVTGSEYVGGVAGFGGTIINSYNTGGVTGSEYVGGVVGYNFKGAVINCYNTGSVTGSDGCVGGVVGISYVTVSNCYNTGSVTGSEYVGGVAGYNWDGTVSNCYNTGSVTGSEYVGGVAGYNPYGTTVINCHNTGSVTGSGRYVGGVVGDNDGTVSNCYYLSGTAAGGIDGGDIAGQAEALTDAQMKNQDSFANWDFHNVWAIDDTNGYEYPQFMKNLDKSLGETSAIWDGTAATGFASGSGTEADPYIIETAGQLAYLAKTVNNGITYQGKYIKLANDIELNDYNAKYWILNAVEWTAIGTGNNHFFGNFDGGGHTVSGIYIDNENNYQSLFGHIGYNGTVKNVGITESYIKGGGYVGGVAGYNSGGGTVSNCYNTGSVTGSSYVGGVVGWNRDGTVSNCYNTGSVMGSDYYVGGVAGFGGTVINCYNAGSVTGSSYVGGVAGYNSYDGTVINCYNTGSVMGSDYYVGGVAGYNSGGGTVSNCYNTGNVTGNNNVGGVAGYSDGTVSNCYNTGSVTGSEYVGGVAGYNSNGTVSNCYNTGSVMGSSRVGGVVGYNWDGTVINCYNTGSVTGSEYVGGVAGYNSYDGTVINCYYLSGTAAGGIDGSDIAGQAEALTDAKMKNQDSFTNWDFHNVWAIDDTNGYEYPQFIINLDKSLGEMSAIWDGTASDGFAGGSGTEADPYIIETAGQLAYLAETVNSGTTYSDKHIKLSNDIELNDYNAKYWILNAVEWTAIGKIYDNAFKGTFDGGEHTVSGIYIDKTNDQGLFGYVYGSTIKNVGVVDSYIKGGNSVGGVVGYNWDGTVSNCHNTGSVTGSENVGGVAGWNRDGTVSNCCNTGSVTGSNGVGGVAGDNYWECTVINCHNTGSVTGSSRVGGVVGYGTVINCYNAGSVIGHFCVGGVAGYNRDGTVSNCYNIGSVAGSENVGGVVGSGTVSNCYNTGSVTGLWGVGGVAGYNRDGTIINCYNTGSVTGSSSVGGVAGDNYWECTVSNCYNTGSVTGSRYVGGVAGYNSYGAVSNCYNTGSVTGNQNVGGVAGEKYSGTVSNCYYLSGTAAGGINGSDIAGQAEVLTDTQMRQQQSFVNWNFTDIWTMDGEPDYPYPELRMLQSVAVTSVSISPDELSMVVNDTRQLTAEVSPSDATNKSVTWASSDTSVATVSANGLVTAIAPGTATITVTTADGGFTDTCEVTVKIHIHTYISRVTVEPTCTTPGVRTYTCTECGDSYTEIIPATGHSWSEWTTVDAATCTSRGTEGRTCARCRLGETRYTDALGHDWSEWTTIREATETENGLKKRVCERCGAVETEIIPSVTTSFTVEAILDQTYTGFEITANVRVFSKVGSLRLDEYEHFMVEYENNTLAGTATAVITGIGEHYGSVSVPFNIVKANISDTQIEPIPSVTETGEDIKPDPVIRYGGRLLVQGTDYTLAYTSDITPDTVKVTVTGKGNFTGTKTVSFTILKNNANFSVDAVGTQAWTGGELTPYIVVTSTGDAKAKSGAVILTEGVDYTLEYSDNTDIGFGTATIIGMGDYRGTIKLIFRIECADLNGAEVADISGAEYTGAAFEPNLTGKLTFGGRTLVEGTDYIVETSRNILSGAAEIKIIGIGNFSGTIKLYANIAPADISGDGFTVDSLADEIYNGAAHTPSVILRRDGKALTEGVDYSVSYSSNINAGTATATVSGVGNFTGTTTATFEIVSSDVAATGITLSNAELQLQYKNTAKLTVTVNPPNATNKNVTWKSSNEKVATVDQNGNVTAKGRGTAAITVTVDGTNISDTCVVTVKLVWWQWLIKILLFGWIWY